MIIKSLGIALTKIGDKGQLTVERDGEMMVLDLTYAAAPAVEAGTHKP